MRLFITLLSSMWLLACSYTPTQLPPMPLHTRLSVIQVNILLGQLVLAKKHLEQIEIPSQGREYWRLNSLYWLRLGSYNEAFLTHKKALSLFPRDEFVLNNYGVLLAQNKRWNQACKMFEKADQYSRVKRLSVQINLARCAIRQEEVNLASLYLNRAKEIAELPLIGLMTELILVLIQGNYNEARIIFDGIGSRNVITRESGHFDEYNCLSKQFIALETDPTSYSSTSVFRCLNGKV